MLTKKKKKKCLKPDYFISQQQIWHELLHELQALLPARLGVLHNLYV